MQIIPSNYFNNMPCSKVALQLAYADIYYKSIDANEIVKTRADGYLSLKRMDMYCNLLFHVKKAKLYGSTKRFTLKEFLETNDKQCIVCILGHYIYVDKKNYYSFFNNEYDKVVKIWYVEAIKQ